MLRLRAPRHRAAIRSQYLVVGTYEKERETHNNRIRKREEEEERRVVGRRGRWARAAVSTQTSSNESSVALHLDLRKTIRKADRWVAFLLRDEILRW